MLSGSREEKLRAQGVPPVIIASMRSLEEQQLEQRPARAPSLGPQLSEQPEQRDGRARASAGLRDKPLSQPVCQAALVHWTLLAVLPRVMRSTACQAQKRLVKVLREDNWEQVHIPCRSLPHRPLCTLRVTAYLP